MSCGYALYYLGQMMLAATTDKAPNLNGLVNTDLFLTHT